MLANIQHPVSYCIRYFVVAVVVFGLFVLFSSDTMNIIKGYEYCCVKYKMGRGPRSKRAITRSAQSHLTAATKDGAQIEKHFMGIHGQKE